MLSLAFSFDNLGLKFMKHLSSLIKISRLNQNLIPDLQQCALVYYLPGESN